MLIDYLSAVFVTPIRPTRGGLQSARGEDFTIQFDTKTNMLILTDKGTGGKSLCLGDVTHVPIQNVASARPVPIKEA